LLLQNGTVAKRLYTLVISASSYGRATRGGHYGNIPTDVLLSAYKGTDGTVAVVAINKGAASATVPITISGATAPAA